MQLISSEINLENVKRDLPPHYDRGGYPHYRSGILRAIPECHEFETVWVWYEFGTFSREKVFGHYAAYVLAEFGFWGGGVQTLA